MIWVRMFIHVFYTRIPDRNMPSFSIIWFGNRHGMMLKLLKTINK